MNKYDEKFASLSKDMRNKVVAQMGLPKEAQKKAGVKKTTKVKTAGKKRG